MILADYGVNGQSPSKVATSGTSAVYFPRLIFAAAAGSFPGISTPATPTAANATGQLMLPGSQYFAAFQGQRIRAVASGSVFTGASGNVTVTVQINTGSLTSPAYTTLMATAATTVNGRASWHLESHFTVAGNSSLAADTQTSGYQANFGSPAPLIQGQLSGEYFGNINGTLVDLTAIPATTNAVIVAGSPLFNTAGLVCNVLFGTGNAANVATLNQFALLGD